MSARHAGRAGAAALALALTLGAGAAGAADQPPQPGEVRDARFSDGPVQLGSGGVDFSSGPVALPDGPVSFPSAPLVQQAAKTSKEVRLQLMTDVLFDFDKADLRPEAEGVLEDLAARIKQAFERPKVRVEGHTDALGSDAYNQSLSERRAESVRGWLAERGGLPAKSLAAAGLGEARPVAPNVHLDGSDDPEGRQRNRRVEVTVSAGG